MNSRLVLVAGLLLTAACSSEVVEGPASTASPAVAELAQDTPVDPGSNEPPYGNGAETGKPYDYSLWVHCGVRTTRIDGVWWNARPNIAEGDIPGVGRDNAVSGTMTITDADSAALEGPEFAATFRRTEATEPPFLCE